VLWEVARQVEALQGRVAELEEQVSVSSRNSSQPPSQDGPGAPRPPLKKKSGRPRGGQKGHPGHARALLSFDSPVPVEMIQFISRGTTLRVKVEFPGYESIYDAFSLKGSTAAMRAAYNACIKLGDGDPDIKKYFPVEPRTSPAPDDSRWF
jgi:hypothetical protein